MHYIMVILIGLLATSSTQAKVLRTKEPYSKREDMAVDVPYETGSSRFVVRDTINGKKVNTNGAPVVVFDGEQSQVVGTVPTGTQLELKGFMSHRGMIFWPVTYTDQQGQQKRAWINGQFVERQ